MTLCFLSSPASPFSAMLSLILVFWPLHNLISSSSQLLSVQFPCLSGHCFLLLLLPQLVRCPLTISSCLYPLFPALVLFAMPPKTPKRAPIKMADLYTRDYVPSLKSSDLINETQRKAWTIDPNGLTKDDLVLWFFHFRHANRQMMDKLTSLEASLTKETSANASLQLDLTNKSDLHELKKFEENAVKNLITASNMRNILLEIGFPSLSVSFN